MIVNGHEYEQNKWGGISQVNPHIGVDYDFQYIADRYGNLGPKIRQMSYLRYAYMLGVLQSKPKTLLEIGYGTGDFLKVCAENGIECFGHDITGIPVPNGVEYADPTKQVNTVCMFDVLEHMIDPEAFLRSLDCRTVYISIPWCMQFDEEYLSNEYIHLRPNEHLHHFDHFALQQLFSECGYMLKSYWNIEDAIRKRDQRYPNILTAIFERRID